MALRTDVGRSGRCDGVATVVALPVRQAATWTNIPNKFTRRCVAAQGTLHIFVSLFHLIYLHLLPVLIGRTLLARMCHELPAASTDMGVLPGVLGCWPL